MKKDNVRRQITIKVHVPVNILRQISWPLEKHVSYDLICRQLFDLHVANPNDNRGDWYPLMTN